MNQSKKRTFIWILVFILAVGAGLWGVFSADETPTPTTPNDSEIPADVAEHIEAKSDLITLDDPQPLDTVSSPLSISGEARGQWYFEASFSVRIIDANGNELGEHYATAQGDWMTEEFVPFTSELTFSTPTTEEGTLILEKANPSGLEENADELRIPVRFNPEEAPAERTVNLYYYNPEADTDVEGNIMCSDAGLVAVERSITGVQTPITSTVELLLEGELTSAEEDQGITTDFPLAGFSLEGINLEDGVATLEFSDPQNSSSGGSCRVTILHAQIRETVSQFEAVEEVRIIPETILQP